MNKLSFLIAENDAGQRADRFLTKILPGLNSGNVQALFRRKDVKLNGKHCKPDVRLEKGQTFDVYLPDTDIRGKSAEQEKNIKILPKPEIVFEDEDILLLWKPAGLLSQSDEDGGDSVEERARQYLSAGKENSFIPSLCHRLDRGTSGLLIMAKTAQALRILTREIKNRSITKLYQCVVHGVPEEPAGEMSDMLFKDSSTGRVMVKNCPGAKSALLCYKTLQVKNGLSLLQIRLVTGRTHQIRVSLASRGLPVLGDGKYGNTRLDKPFHPKRMALCAYKISFSCPELPNLDGKTFEHACDFDLTAFD